MQYDNVVIMFRREKKKKKINIYIIATIYVYNTIYMYAVDRRCKFIDQQWVENIISEILKIIYLSHSLIHPYCATWRAANSLTLCKYIICTFLLTWLYVECDICIEHSIIIRIHLSWLTHECELNISFTRISNDIKYQHYFHLY